MAAGHDAEQPSFRGSWHGFEAPANLERLFSQGKGVGPLGQVGERRFRAQALSQHDAVVGCLEVCAGLGKQALSLIRLGQLQMCHRDEIADPPQPVGRGPEVKQRPAQHDGLAVATVGDHGFEVGERHLGFIDGAPGIGEEELDRFAGAMRDVLERG
jgi:hypothetical protein